MSDQQRTRMWIGVLTSSVSIQLFIIVMITAVEDGRYTFGKAVVQLLAGLVFCCGVLVVQRNFRRTP